MKSKTYNKPWNWSVKPKEGCLGANDMQKLEAGDKEFGLEEEEQP